jgi:hypothetical protein
MYRITPAYELFAALGRCLLVLGLGVLDVVAVAWAIVAGRGL